MGSLASGQPFQLALQSLLLVLGYPTQFPDSEIPSGNFCVYGSDGLSIGGGNFTVPECAVFQDALPDSVNLLSGVTYVETDATEPLNLYGASKLEGERRVLAPLDTTRRDEIIQRRLRELTEGDPLAW